MSSNTNNSDASDAAIFKEWMSMEKSKVEDQQAFWGAVKSSSGGNWRGTSLYKASDGVYDPDSEQFLGNTKSYEEGMSALGENEVSLMYDCGNAAETMPEIINYVPDAVEPEDAVEPIKENGEGPKDKETGEEIVKKEEEEAAEEAEEDKGEINTKVGGKCEVKKLYAGTNRRCDCCIKWEDHKPDAGNEGIKEERDGYAILYRLIPHGGDDEWKTHSIRINSTRLKLRLERVFEDYPGIDPDEMTFKHPFAPFLHRWDRLLELQETEKDPETADHIKLLRQLLEHELKEPFKAMKKFAETGLISFDNMIYALVPGEIITSSQNGEPCAALLRSVERHTKNDSPEYRYYVEMIDADSKRFGVFSTVWGLRCWNGTIQMASLQHFPLRLHPERETVKERLIERGRKFERLQGQHYKAYRGKGVFEKEDGEPQLKPVRLNWECL